jgi:hypothetical protein
LHESNFSRICSQPLFAQPYAEKDGFSISRKNPIVARMRNLEESYLSLEDFTQGSLHQQIPSIKVVGILKNIQVGSF